MTYPITPPAVFVYGTLRPGQGNHAWTVGHLPHRTIPATAGGFRLVGADRGYPYALPAPGETTRGDLLVFDPPEWPEALRAMDALEGYPLHYGRHVAVVHVDGDPDRSARAWIYVPHDRHRFVDMEPVPGNDWLNAGRARRPYSSF